jgi:hypothetical protein
MKKLNYLFLILFMLVCQVANAQNPPVMQWHWSGSYNNNSGTFNNVENWFYHVISTDDGGYIGVGFTEETFNATTKYVNPSAVKVDANGKEVWSVFYNEGNSQSGGVFYDAIEVTDGYVFAGHKKDHLNNDLQSIYVVKVDKNTGAKINSAYFNAATLPGYSNTETPLGRFIRPIYSGGFLTGYILAGTSQCIPGTSCLLKNRGILLIKTDINFAINNINFGSGGQGWEVYNRGSSSTDIEQEATEAEQVRVIYNNNNPATGIPLAFMVTGSTINTTSNSSIISLPHYTDRDACILKAGLLGNKIWICSYSDAITGQVGVGSIHYNLSAYGYNDNNSLNVNCCPSVSNVIIDNDEESAGDFEQISNNQAIICAKFDALSVYLGSGGAANCFNLPPENSYVANDAVLFKIDLSTGTPLNSPVPTKVLQSSSIDFKTRMVMDANNIYVSGGNCNIPINSTTNYLATDIIKVNRNNFALPPVWKKSYISKNDNVANCTFGLALCKDGGIIFGGNNELNDEDFFLTKLYGDCQTNLTNLFDNDGIDILSGTTTWGAGTKRIRGILRIKSGAKLIINSGAVIRFADTRRYNDFDYLAGKNNTDINFVVGNVGQFGANSQPTKIIIEPGGRLEIDGLGTVLKGLNVCGSEAMWEGIEILGTPNLNQGTVNQGLLQVTNGAVIENMYAGITVGENSYDAKGQPTHALNKGGGIIRMSGGSKIKNSRYGVYFSPYTFNNVPNLSFFNGALFECSGIQPLVDPNFVDNQGNKLGTDVFVQAALTNRIRFQADCRFIGNTNLLVKHRGTGILCDDAAVTVDGTNHPAGNFADLFKGINCRNFTASKSLSVTGNRFQNNVQAINLKAGTFGGLYNNLFYVPVAGNNAASYIPYGVYLNGTPNLTVSGNKFYGLGSGAAADGNYGVIVNDHGTSASSITTNEFGQTASNGLYVGVQAQLINGISGTNTQGVQINCNTFNSPNYFDWTVPDLDPDPAVNSSVLCAQGFGGLSNQTQAGNTFYDVSCSIPFNNINSSYAFNYHFRTGFPLEATNCTSSNITRLGSQGNLNTCVPCINCERVTVKTIESEPDINNKALLRNSLIANTLSDGDSAQVVNELLSVESTDDAKKQLVSSLINQRQLPRAQKILNSIASNNQENIDFKTMYQILLDLAIKNQTIFNLTDAQAATIANIANSNTINKYAAQAIMSIAKGNIYKDQIYNIGANNQK